MKNISDKEREKIISEPYDDWCYGRKPNNNYIAKNKIAAILRIEEKYVYDLIDAIEILLKEE